MLPIMIYSRNCVTWTRSDSQGWMRRLPSGWNFATSGMLPFVHHTPPLKGISRGIRKSSPLDYLGLSQFLRSKAIPAGQSGFEPPQGIVCPPSKNSNLPLKDFRPKNSLVPLKSTQFHGFLAAIMGAMMAITAFHYLPEVPDFSRMWQTIFLL